MNMRIIIHIIHTDAGIGRQFRKRGEWEEDIIGIVRVFCRGSAPGISRRSIGKARKILRKEDIFIRNFHFRNVPKILANAMYL